ncbi:MAG: YcjF family protein, partial [Hydrogenophaga sp.]
MNPTEQQALLTIALLAAFSDGNKADAERDAIKSLAESLDEAEGAVPLNRIYQDVLLKRVTLADAVGRLSDEGQRQLAYEMAVCVCDADGGKTDAEAAFLADLRSRLGLGSSSLAAFESEEQALVAAAATSLPAGVPGLAVVEERSSARAASPVAPAGSAPLVHAERDAALDKMILKSATINGALELLPQSWASMAIIPLQVRMVYNIGKAHGVELDQGHIREFIAAVGVGLTSQYIEQFGRKLIGGLIGSAAGRMIGGMGRAATGMAFSFATTYALGQVAKRYYAGGRVMGTAVLRDTFQQMLGPAKQMQ